MTTTFQTGFFGVPGSSRGRFTVHIVDQNGRPICGWRPRKEQQFQWCANGIHYDYVRGECKTCARRGREILALALANPAPHVGGTIR